jgi:chromosomal replication initiation ATPase DnaA
MSGQPPDPTPAQLVLDLPLEPATGAGDYLVGAGNASAVALVEAWPNWPQPSALIVGPPASGKTHLASVWQSRTRGAVVAASELSDATVALFRAGETAALVVEDLDRAIADDRVLFHLLNHARESLKPMLLTSAAAPGELHIALPDLRSRLRALAMVTIEPPDDALLTAILVKLFADRQIDVEPAVVGYLARHMERSFEAARRMVAAIDRLSLARKRRITKAIAAEALAGETTNAEPADTPETPTSS